MEERILNLEVPFLSVRRRSAKPEYSSESEKDKKKKKNEKTKRVIHSCPNTEHQTPLCLPGQSFDHLTEPASVPFVWEQTPGRPKNIVPSELSEEEEEQDDDEVYSDSLGVVSSNGYSSVNCSSSGVSEFEKSGDKSGDIPEYRDLMMSRFLPAAKAMAMQQQDQQQENQRISSPAQKKKQSRLNREEAVVRERKPLVRKQEPVVAIPSHCEDVNKEEDEESEDDDSHDHVYSKVSKKGRGFLPRLCVKNSLSVLHPVSSLRIKTCQDLGKPGKIIQPKPMNSISKETLLGLRAQSSPRIRQSNRIVNDSGDLQQRMMPSWSSRRLSGFISPYRYASSRSSLSESGFVGTPDKAEIYRVNRLYRGMSKSQELYPRNTREIMGFSNSPVKSGSTRTPSRMQRTGTDQKHEAPLTRSYSTLEGKFLAQEAKKRRSSKRSGNLVQNPQTEQQSLATVSTPPLPKTPTESWLVRTLPSVTPRSSISNPYIIKALAKSKSLLPESTKWETIVKTSYIHHDHVRYSEELIVHPLRQPKTYTGISPD